MMQSTAVIGCPPIILEGGVVGSSTIYTNNTSAKVNVTAPLFDYVDNNDYDIDSSADGGLHSNFAAQQAGPDSIYDTLSEENMEAIEDYVDNDTSDVDNSPDVGTHSNFENEKLRNGIYDTLTESVAVEEIIRDAVTQGQSTSATVTFSHTLGYSSGNNRLVVVAAGFENDLGDINIGSATYNGQSMTKVVQATTGAGYVASVALFYLLDSSLPSSSGSYSVVVTAASDPLNDLWACAISYTGVKQEASDDYDSDYYVGSTTMTSNLDCVEVGSVLIQACVVGNTGSFTPSSGTTEVIEDGDITSASAVFNEKLDQDSGTRSLGCTHGNMNRGAWVGACWAPASDDAGYDLDVEVQFTSVIDFLPIEKLCIYTGTLGDEDLRVDYWNGTGWENLATDLNAYSCNEYAVSLTSTTFTIRFKGENTSGDATQDQWQIDASLLRVEGAGSKEDAVDNDTSNVDGSADVGTLSNFDNMKTKDGMANLTEGASGGQTVWLWQEDTSGYTATSSYETYQFWSSWTTNSTTSGTITKIGIYIFENPGDSPQVKLGIYSDIGGVPNNLLGETNAATITSAGWLDLDIVGGGVSISASTTYHVAHITNTAPTTQWRYIKAATPTSRYRNNRVWPNLFSPAGTTTAATTNRYGAYRVGYVIPYYRLDQEVQWTSIPHLLPNEELCIYGGTMGAEDIKVDVWNGSSWANIISDINASAWNNVTIASFLTSSTFTIRFRGGTETGDSNQDTWQIDVALVHIWYEGGESYELNLEVQWTNADYTRTNAELCIKTGTFTGSENIQARVWNNTGSSWHWVMNLTANQWNNVTIMPYLASSIFTIQFLGGTETGDSSEDSWNIEATILHVWTDDATYDYVLIINNTETDSWQVRLKKYSDSNINRIQNCTIYFHNSTDGTSGQTYIVNGAYTQDVGPWYNLPSLATIYIAMTVQANSLETSYVYVYLEVIIPNTTTYAQYVVTFVIT
jgi:hypothetical protein